MNITLPQLNLKAALSIVGRGVPTRPVNPILGGILLEAVGGELLLTGTDLDRRLMTSVPVEDDGEASAIVVRADLLSALVGALPAGPVKLVTEAGRRLTLTAGPQRATLAGFAADDYPPALDPGDALTFDLPAGPLLAAIEQTWFAAGEPDNPRPVLTGVNLRAAGDTLTLAGCDSFRLALHSLTLAAALPECEVTVPAVALRDALAVFEAAGEPLTLALSRAGGESFVRLTLEQGRTMLAMTLLNQGPYPNVASLIPAAGTTRAVLARKPLLDLLAVAAIVAKQDVQRVWLAVTPGNPGAVHVSAAVTEIGESAGELAATVTGEPLSIALSGDYLRAAIAAIPTETVIIDLTAPNAPCVIRPAEEGDRALHLVMPQLDGTVRQ